MKTPRKQSPARSQGSVRTPIRHRHRRSLSVSSARSQASGRLTTLIKQSRNLDVVVMSPLGIRKSILSDNTEIEEPRRNSWWKKLGENSTDVLELLNEEKVVQPNNIIQELDMEILSQENKKYSLDIPESSDNESINSIVIPQRKLFTQKENLPQKKFGQIIGTRETLAKLHKTNTTIVQPTVNAGTRELFQNKQRSKPIFPAALLSISPNKTAADKTRDLATVEPKAQVRNIFGSRATKRKNIFTNFILSESEDEIPEIQPKIFGFQKKIEARRRGSSSSRGLREPSPTSSITTDIEMDDWKMLPSSTMVENQLEAMMADGQSPKRARLSKLTEIESETGSNATRHSNKSVSSKDKSRKSKTFTKEIVPETETSTTIRNKSKVSEAENEEILDYNKSTKDTDKSRKSKTFTKEKASESETLMTTRNKSKLCQNDNEDILDNERSMKETEKYRISKTFTKEKTLQALETSMTASNKSKVSQDDNDETLVENKSSKALDKSRKSKTFIKETDLDLETSMTTRNKSKTYFPTSAQNKSKIHDDNLSQSSIKTRSKTNSPNTSLNQEPDLNDKSTALNKSKLKNSTTSSKDKSKQASEETPVETNQGNDDDDLNFSLKYDDKDNEETNTKTKLSKNMSQNETPASLSKSNKNLQNEVVEESAELESTEEKSNSIKVADKSQIKDGIKAVEEDQIQENEDVEEDAANNSDSNNDRNEMEVDENKESSNECEDEQNESHKNVSETLEDNENEEDNNLESEEENNDESIDHNNTEVNESQEHQEKKNEEDVENDEEDVENNEEDEENNEDEDSNDESEEIQEQEESIEVQTQSEPETESQEMEEDEKDNNESQEENNDIEEIEQEQNDSQLEQQNESEVVQNESNVEQNESQEIEQEYVSQELEIENEDEVKNISQEEMEHDTDMEHKSEIEENAEQNESEVQDGEEQNESGIEDNEEQNDSEDQEEQNESGIEDNEEQNDSDDQEEQNESEDNEDLNESADNEEESEAIADTDDAEPYQSQEVANESGNQDTDEVESGQEIETPDVSHDTTGRNRKKNESPEVILNESKNHSGSFSFQGGNTSVRKTMMKSMHIRPSLASHRESTGFSDGTENSSAAGSGWDSHRTTRKTLRQTFGKDFTPRKSLRALVMEKSAKRQTQNNEMASVTAKFPQANSTELPEMSNRFEDEANEIQESNHEVSLRTRQTTLENYLEKIKEKNAETRLKIEEAVRESLKAPPKDIFKVPAKPFFARRLKPAAKKPTKSTLFLGELPDEVMEDFKYKPPKRFAPSNAPWITKRLYKFLETKLEPKYDYKARLRSEKLVENIYHFAKDVRRRDVASSDAVDVLKREMARLQIVKTHFDFYEFFHQFMPREVRVKVIPDIVNNISLPRHGVFADIL